MDQITLSAEKRSILGGKVRFLRRQGITPANIFGRNIDSTAVQIDTITLNQVLAKAGTTSIISLGIEGEKSPKSVVVKSIQRHPLTRDLIHVDLYEVKMAEKIKLEVPLELVGESPAVKDLEGILIQNLSTVDIECLPADMPHSIEVNLAILDQIDQALHVSDLTIDENITILTDPEKVIVVITGSRIAAADEEEAAEAEAKADVEIVGKTAEEAAE